MRCKSSVGVAVTLVLLGTGSLANAAPVGAAVLVPGRSIGGIEIGQTRKQVQDLGLGAVEPQPAMGARFARVGPFLVVFDADDHVSSVEYRLPTSPGVRIGATTFAADATMNELARGLPGCGAVESRFGGNVISCSGGTTLVKEMRVGGRLSIAVQVLKR